MIWRRQNRASRRGRNRRHLGHVDRDADGRPLDSIQAVRASTAGRLCASNEFPQATWVRWTREVYDDYDRLVATRAYHTLPAAGEGLPGTNYDETTFGYDVMDRRNRVRTPAGTITRTTFDVLGRPTGTWVGTNDAGATDADPAGGGAAGNNLRHVAAQAYPGGCDCVQPASRTQFVDANPANNRVTSYVLDFRNRVVGVAGELGFYELRQYDNLNQLTRVERYDGASGPLLARSETFYDNRGRMYRTRQYAVSGGVVGNALEANTWYDAAQNPVKQVAAGAQDGRAFTKHAYDGLGRLTASYQGYYTGALPEPYADVGRITLQDKLFEQTLSTFDPAGNLLTTAFYQRLDDATGTSPLQLPSSGAQPRARVSYRAGWFDGIGRPVTSADYGTNGDLPLVRPPVPPARSDTVLVTSQTYDPAGSPVETLDPAGRRARQAFDARDRLTESISHATDGCPGHDHDVTVRYAYDADGHLAALTAVNPATGDQTTRYQYGTSLGDSALASRELLRSVVYPDSAGGDDRVTYAYNRQGQVTRLTDQNGTVHDYAYDRLGRPTADAASALGPGIDGAVRRLGREYDPLGRVLRVTSLCEMEVIGTEIRSRDVERFQSIRPDVKITWYPWER